MGALDGKVAIVTGAGRGLGRTEALELAREGAKVVVNDLGAARTGEGADQTPAQTVVDEVSEAGGQAVANYDDVASWEGAQALVKQAIDHFGDLHILVNNAGILRDKMSFNMEEDEWDAVVRVHLKGHFAPSRFALQYWREQGKAGNDAPRRIINTTSESGLFGNAGQTNYGAAKAGIVAMGIAMAREVSRYPITVNSIAPRALTRMTEDLMGVGGNEIDQSEMAPEHIAPVVAWLASDAAGDVNGQVFVVFGGRVALMQGFTVVNTLRKSDGLWTVEELEKARGELFGDRPSGLPPFTLVQ